MAVILQARLPFLPWLDPRTARLPGVLPLEGEDWLQRDDAYAGQMAVRDRLIAGMPEVVVAVRPEGRAAAEELYDLVLARLTAVDGYRVGVGSVMRPDGVAVTLDRANPLATLGRLVQEDLCLLERQGDEHVLTGAVLCFPSSWSLAEKLGRPLGSIHRTVKTYDPELARRVQRMFDVIRVGQPLWRMNALIYADPDLHQPGYEAAPRTERRTGRFVRSERQCFVRLPTTGAVLFAIHTYVVALESLNAAERAALETARL